MKQKQLPYHEAYNAVKGRRKWTNPNSGFREQLIEYNSRLGLAPPPIEYQPPSFWKN
jgi:protein-tyrosine phosphatase